STSTTRVFAIARLVSSPGVVGTSSVLFGVFGSSVSPGVTVAVLVIVPPVQSASIVPVRVTDAAEPGASAACWYVHRIVVPASTPAAGIGEPSASVATQSALLDGFTPLTPAGTVSVMVIGFA